MLYNTGHQSSEGGTGGSPSVTACVPHSDVIMFAGGTGGSFLGHSLCSAL